MSLLQDWSKEHAVTLVLCMLWGSSITEVKSACCSASFGAEKEGVNNQGTAKYIAIGLLWGPTLGSDAESSMLWWHQSKLSLTSSAVMSEWGAQIDSYLSCLAAGCTTQDTDPLLLQNTGWQCSTRCCSGKCYEALQLQPLSFPTSLDLSLAAICMATLSSNRDLSALWKHNTPTERSPDRTNCYCKEA